MYSAALLEHFNNPQNSGDLPGADVRVRRENPVCGDVLELALKSSAGRIEEVRFKAKGCVPAIACASALTTLIQRRTIAEAFAVKREDLLHAVHSVPSASTHAIDLALDALYSALKNLS
jgi:nitrogen fixation NifU-like protein